MSEYEEGRNLEERIGDLERKLRLCGIKVVSFAGLKGKITEYKGNPDVYRPDTVPDLIHDVIGMMNAKISEWSEEVIKLTAENPVSLQSVNPEPDDAASHGKNQMEP